MMCFKDDSIFAWDSETMRSLYHLHVPTPGEKSPGFKTFAVSKYVSLQLICICGTEIIAQFKALNIL